MHSDKQLTGEPTYKFPGDQEWLFVTESAALCLAGYIWYNSALWIRGYMLPIDFKKLLTISLKKSDNSPADPIYPHSNHSQTDHFCGAKVSHHFLFDEDWLHIHRKDKPKAYDANIAVKK